MGPRRLAVLCTAILFAAACSNDPSGPVDSDAAISIVDSASPDDSSLAGPAAGVNDPAASGNDAGSDPEATGDPAGADGSGDDGATVGATGTDPSGDAADSDAAATGDPVGDDGAGDEGTDPAGGAGTAPDLSTAIAAYPFTLWPSAPGASGETVVALQDRLTELGIGAGASDGSYGRRTVAAVAAFQRLVDLEPTGEADSETIAAITDYHYDGLLLRRGDEGSQVEQLQQRLRDGPFDPGPIDGDYGSATVQAVWALEKLAGMPTDGDWGPLDEKAWQLLMAGEIGRPERSHETRWVEVDLSQQLVKVYDPDADTPTLISHASSGSGIPWENEEHSGSSITPRGDFHISRRISGWRESSLNIGRLYNPLYFNGGIAFHGATSVPLYPASHGCVRLPMHIAEYLPGELPNGTAVHVMS